MESFWWKVEGVVKSIRVAGLIVLLSGVALTGRAAYLRAKAELARVLIQRAWAEEERNGVAVKPWSWADMHPVARLRISRIGYDEYVLDNAAARTLAFGPGVVGNGVAIGEEGNLAIAGHRTTWFLKLEEVRTGDRIELQWFEEKKRRLGEREYVVERTEVVEPADVRLLKPVGGDALTLITCYPFGYGASSPQRFVVRATPVTESVTLKNGAAERR